MSHIHFIGGEKGGVGKSMMARVLAQYFIDHEMPFAGFDTDQSHGALLRFYSGYASALPVDATGGLDAIVEAVVDQPAREVLVDLAAQTHAPLIRWMDECGLVEIAGELSLNLHYWHVMDSGKDSVDLLKRLLDRFGNRLDYVIVRNQVRGDDFGILDRSGELARARELGARVVNLRRLPEGLVNKIDSANSSFWAAKNASEKAATGLGLLDRQRIKVWLRDAYREIAAAHPASVPV